MIGDNLDKIAASDIRPGDMLDLFGDPYAGRDPAWPRQTWQEARQTLEPGYVHTAGDNFAKLRERGRGMDHATIRHNDDGDHWIVYLR